MTNYHSAPSMSQTRNAPHLAEIKTMFDRLAGRYDLFNRLTSLGLDHFWRVEAVRFIRPGMSVLDIGCGTGDLTLEARRQVGETGSILGLDFSENMLVYAEKKFKKIFPEAANVRFKLGSAEELPIDGRRFDAIISAFVLRNIYENIDKILDGVYESLSQGGAISFLDITEPRNKGFLKLWQFYMSTAAAMFGKLLFGKDYPSFYLTESAHRFLKKNEFMEKLSQKGFLDVRVRSFLFGIIVLYQARKA